MKQTRINLRRINTDLKRAYHKNCRDRRKGESSLSDIIPIAALVVLCTSVFLEFFWGKRLTNSPNGGMLVLIIIVILLFVFFILLGLYIYLITRNGDDDRDYKIRMEAMDGAMEELMKSLTQFSSKTSLLALLLARYPSNIILNAFAELVMIAASIYVIVKMPGLTAQSNLWMIIITVVANLLAECLISFMGVAIKHDSFRRYTLPEYLDWLLAKENENCENET